MKSETGLASLGLIVFIFFAIIGSFIANGWALSVMWGWFVVPLFGLPALSIPAAIGLSMVVGMLTHQTMPTEKDKSAGLLITGIIAHAILTPLLIVAVGYIIKSFM